MKIRIDIPNFLGPRQCGKTTLARRFREIRALLYLLSPIRKPTKVTGKETGQREEKAVFSDTGQA